MTAIERRPTDDELTRYLAMPEGSTHHRLAAEVERWKRIAQDRCTCRLTCGDTPEDSGGICKELPRA